MELSSYTRTLMPVEILLIWFVQGTQERDSWHVIHCAAQDSGLKERMTPAT